MATRRDWKDADRRKVKAASQGDLWKPVEGTNYFRVLPDKRGMEHRPYLDWGVHREVGPDNALLRCGKGTEADSCWLCGQLAAVVARDPSKRTVAEQMARSDELVVQILPINVETQQPESPRAWWLKVGGKRSMGIRLISLLSTPTRDYDDPNRGYNISLERTGMGQRNTEYGPFEPDQEPSRIDKSVRGQMKELEELIPAYNPGDQKAAFYGRERVTQADAASTDDWNRREPGDDRAAEDAGDSWEDPPARSEEPPPAAPAEDDWGDTGETTQVSGLEEETSAADSAEDDGWDWGDTPEPEPPAEPAPARRAAPAKPTTRRAAPKPAAKKAPARRKVAKPAAKKPTAKHVAKKRR